MLVSGIDRSMEKVRIQSEKIELFGRAAEVQHLCNHFLDSSLGETSADDVPVTKSHMAVITGPSGMGKTSLAICVAHQLLLHYPQQYLFQSSTLDILKAELVRFAKVHLLCSGSGSVADELNTAEEYFKAHFGWLLVVDDVTDAHEVIEYFAPIVQASKEVAAASMESVAWSDSRKTMGGVVILTTQRSLRADRLTACKEIHLQGLTRESSVDILKKVSFHEKKISKDIDYSDPIVSNFLDEVTGNHPLAVTQVIGCHLL